ncbi:probable thimet oligopeptidase isoform X1 [Punica granatum]|uniref:Probable thimet oligopeptidase isoform X1 n=2 Tax=Punica granatum TaxID=22663 RepID=A0A6P8CWV2_PUNGR|nr:probable thimet oligopeptidase isoform X1 [Punica granatum]
MEESRANTEKMNRPKRERQLLALTGAAALLAVAANLAISAVKSHLKNRQRKDLPGCNVRVNLSAREILRLADRVIAKSKEVHDAVASVPLDKVNYTNVVSALAELEAEQFPLVQSCVFPKLVSTSDEVRRASAEAERRIDAHIATCSQREDVYRVVKAFASRGELMNAEAKCYIQCLVKDYERNGLNLTSTKRKEVQRLKAEIDDLGLQYVQNLKDDRSHLLLPENVLLGLPSEFLKSLDIDETGRYKVTLKSHHVAAVLELCKVGETRRTVAVAYGKRCGQVNLTVLEKLVQCRHKLARLLGYSNYADYVLDNRMAKTPFKIFEFLEDISASLTDLAARELSVLKALKKREEGDFPFGIEDLLYYIKRFQEQQFDLDFGAIKQYFPVNLVLSGVFKIFQDLLGLRFEEVGDPKVWHRDVRLFKVFDLSSGESLGYFYLDLYKREGKYSQTCVVALQNRSLCNKNICQMPVVMLIAQFQNDTDSHPGLLRFSEVVNFFHEFGHVIQHICNRASFVRFSGLRVDPDFVEIPAQVFENWCYESLSLKLISGFHQDMTIPIKEELCKSLRRWRYGFSALKLKQEILYSLFDQIIHSADNVDVVELFKHLHPKVMLGLPMLEGTNPATCFPRSAIGYEASCYSRIWSEVFATDIFTSKFRDDLLDPDVGMKFRNKVLAPGGAKDPVKILTDFLGREPSVQAFIDSRMDHSLL